MLERRQSFPVVFKAVFRALASLFALVSKRFHLPAYHTHHSSISCVSLLQVKYHHIGRHQNGPSAKTAAMESLAKGGRRAASSQSPVLLRSPSGVALGITKKFHGVSLGAQEALSLNVS